MRPTHARITLLLVAALLGVSGCGDGDSKPVGPVEPATSAAPVAPIETQARPPEVWLVAFDAEGLISTIKVVREITGLGLKAAKDLVEGAPKLVKVAADRAEADAWAQQLRDAGATVEIR